MTDRFKGKVAIVTGSGQGIGRAIAHLLGREGARVVVNSRSEKNKDNSPTAADTLREIKADGGEAVAAFADVSLMAGAKKVIDTAVETYGTLDILINNAGFGHPTAPMEDVPEETWDHVLDGNLKSQYACMRYALPVMKAKGRGRILNIGSPIGIYGMQQMAAYCAAKAGSMGLTFSVAHELVGTGITVNCLLPSAATPSAEATRAMRQAATGYVVSQNPHRIPEAIAAPALHLVSDAAADISGQVFQAVAGQVKHFLWPPTNKTLYKPGIWTLDELATVFAPYFGEKLEAAKPQPYLR